ncbi:hypothetical protein ACTWP5_16190 [Streptomyces sp. 4N509B]|uniref:hypothetical protein n=1 Tax=Streptomyces sp. 4N509B TaxID=3457413 RepID=UPI003FD20752
MEQSAEEMRADFCGSLARLRQMALGAAPRRRADLERIVRDARRGRDIRPLLLAGGWLGDDGPDTPRGDPSGRNAGSGYMPPAVSGPRPPVPGDYVCPDGSCTRVERRRPGQGPPECLLLERVLTFVAGG